MRAKLESSEDEQAALEETGGLREASNGAFRLAVRRITFVGGGVGGKGRGKSGKAVAQKGRLAAIMPDGAIVLLSLHAATSLKTATYVLEIE